MKSKLRRPLIVLAMLALSTLNSTLSTAKAQGTVFTYQGSLTSNAIPVNGLFDFEFSLYPNAERTGTQVGSTITQTGIGVTNGLFITALDFGDVFTGNDTWLSISVRTNGVGTYTPLTPLQELTPAPYAIFATTASNAVLAAQLSGSVTLAQLPGAVVTNNDPNVTFVNLTLSSNLTLPSPATINSGGNSLLRTDDNDNFYAGPGAGTPTNSGGFNTGIGIGTLQKNINGTNNTAVGYLALANNTNGAYNTASGTRALNANTSGDENTAYGRQALLSNTNGNDNTAIGHQALSALTGGWYNIVLGSGAGINYGGNATSNILIGNPGVGGDNNTIRIGNGQTSAFIAGIINGDGGGLTNLSAAQLSGAISLAQLPAAVVTNHDAASVTLSGTFSGNGAGLTTLDASQLTSGTVPNSVLSGFQGAYSTVGGGQYNYIVSGTQWATIAGGNNNTNGGNAGTIGGGQNNTVTNGGQPTVGGGYLNIASDEYATVGGGAYNKASGYASTVSGGGGYLLNLAIGNTASGDNSFVGGGYENTASGYASTVSGGEGNNASGLNGPTVGGGSADIASGQYSTVPGGAENTAQGDYSFAAGNMAFAGNNGSFVWADSQHGFFSSTADNQVSFRCGGGVLFTSGSGAGNQTVAWTPGSASWSFSSDRNLKDRIAPVSAESVLEKVRALPLAEWSYKGYSQRHIGPMAQDFHALFPLNDNDKMLDDADLHGIALAAIQGLNQKMDEKEARIQEQGAEIEQLKVKAAEVDGLKQRLDNLEQLIARKTGAQP